MPILFRAAFLAAGLSLAAQSLMAGTLVEAPAKKMTVPEEQRRWLPDDPAGLITVGGLFSEHLSGIYLDTITGLFASSSRNSFLFLDSKYRYEDNGQFTQSTGFAFRQRIPGKEIILGINAYYDEINSEHDHDYQQAGFGAEILTRWVDAHFNYYLPEGDEFEVDRFSKRSSSRSSRNLGVFNGLSADVVSQRDQRRSFKTFESALEGFNTEIGVLLPGLDKYAEVRIFAGYHHYNNPYGKDFEGFQARLEAHLLPGVIADVEYWDDTALMGGHWTAGLRASVPFSIYNLSKGRNPFEGTLAQFRPRQRDFQERMSEMVMRSHRIWTTTSGGQQTRATDETRRQVVVNSPGRPPVVVPVGGFPIE